MSHWSERYLGEPWLSGEHDCWQFFRRVQREQFGFDIPEVDLPFDAGNTLSCARALTEGRECDKWSETDRPTEGCAVLLARGTRPTHVGVWVDANGGAVLHCARGSGVVLQDLASLNRHGWGGMRFYRRAHG